MPEIASCTEFQKTISGSAPDIFKKQSSSSTYFPKLEEWTSIPHIRLITTTAL